MNKGYSLMEEKKEHKFDLMPFNTSKEILQQPSVWLKTYHQIAANAGRIKDFINTALNQAATKVVLTGAGSSAFIGDAIYASFCKNLNVAGTAIPTTDILSHPDFYLPTGKPIILVSFARSGNSPESIAVFNLANHICSEVFHIIITCNSQGKLYTTPESDNILKILLPPETNDKSLAMTSSFTSMMLAALLISKVNTIEEEFFHVRTMAGSATHILSKHTETIQKLAQIPFDRAVFLGSGPIRGTAREAQLKVQELTDGKIICKCDSFLGFRHGPKAVVDDKTLIVYLFSDDDYVRQYEQDLVNQMNEASKGMCQVAVFNKPIQLNNTPEYLIELSSNPITIPDEYLCVLQVVVPQILGVYKSVWFGLSPDSPSLSGAISRVVKGVSVYPFNQKEND